MKPKAGQPSSRGVPSNPTGVSDGIKAQRKRLNKQVKSHQPMAARKGTAEGKLLKLRNSNDLVRSIELPDLSFFFNCAGQSPYLCPKQDTSSRLFTKEVGNIPD
jgi:hypothetical protein